MFCGRLIYCGFQLQLCTLQLYNASGYHEALLFAALWMHRATQDPIYLSNALDHFQELQPHEAVRKAAMSEWFNQYWPAMFLLWQLTGEVRLTFAINVKS
jgi:hypothetical protein